MANRGPPSSCVVYQIDGMANVDGSDSDLAYTVCNLYVRSPESALGEGETEKTPAHFKASLCSFSTAKSVSKSSL